jgi:hypothetical protein
MSKSITSFQVAVEWSDKPNKMIRLDHDMPEELEAGLSEWFAEVEKEENSK